MWFVRVPTSMGAAANFSLSENNKVHNIYIYIYFLSQNPNPVRSTHEASILEISITFSFKICATISNNMLDMATYT
jgi:hypothetical protein